MAGQGDFERQTIYNILDAMPMAHIGYVQENSPVVMPTIQWREGDYVYWHASNGGRGVKSAVENEVCLTVSILDALVLARSGLRHAVNYRSVMVFGKPTLVADSKAKKDHLNRMIDTLYPGRSETLHPMSDIDVKQTAVLSLPIAEASAKIRDYGPLDEDKDCELAVWAGVVPVQMQLLTPEADDRNPVGVKVPSSLAAMTLG